MRMKRVQVLSGISCQSFFLVFVILIFYFRKRFFCLRQGTRGFYCQNCHSFTCSHKKAGNIDAAIYKAFLEKAALFISKNWYLTVNIQFAGKIERETYHIFM